MYEKQLYTTHKSDALKWHNKLGHINFYDFKKIPICVLV